MGTPPGINPDKRSAVRASSVGLTKSTSMRTRHCDHYLYSLPLEGLEMAAAAAAVAGMLLLAAKIWDHNSMC